MNKKPPKKTMNSDELLVKDEEFKEEILSKLNQLRKEGILCDVTLRIDGQDFPAHRCVLSAASPYFRALFAFEFKLIENESNRIELQDIKSTAAKEVLDFMYTGQVVVNSTNAQDLLRVADYLIIPSLKSKVATFLEVTIDATNCLLLESFGAQFNCKSLEEAAMAYKLQNFAAVVKSEDFKALDFDKVKQLVCHDDIIVSKEEDVYEAVMKWVKHDVLARENLLPELLKCVRLFSMSKYSLKKILEDEELIKEDSTCTNILHKGMDFFLFPDDFEGTLLEPRKCLTRYEHAVVLTGGHCKDQRPSAKTFGFSLSTNKWVSLSMMPCSRTRHGAAVCGGQLYTIGGKSPQPVTVCCFNPNCNKWSCVASLRRASRRHCSVTTYQEELYVVGGEGFWCSSIKFDPKRNKWTRLMDMTTPRAAHCAVAMVNGICVIAGHDEHVCHKTVEIYNPVTDQWSQMPDLVKARRFASAATISGEKILVVGGYSNMEFKVIEASCEMFDPAGDQWSLVSSPVGPRAACGIVTFNNRVYVFGGEDASLEKNSRYLNSVECYCIQKNQWQLFGTMPERLSCLQASLVLLPKKFLYEEEEGDCFSSSGEEPDESGDDGDGDENNDDINGD